MIGLVISAILIGASIAIVQHLIEERENKKLKVEVERNKKIFESFREEQIEKLANMLRKTNGFKTSQKN